MSPREEQSTRLGIVLGYCGIESRSCLQTFISPRQPPSFTPWLLISRVWARWLSLLPAIQTRTGTTDLVLFDRRFPVRDRGMFLTPSIRRRFPSSSSSSCSYSSSLSSGSCRRGTSAAPDYQEGLGWGLWMYSAHANGTLRKPWQSAGRQRITGPSENPRRDSSMCATGNRGSGGR